MADSLPPTAEYDLQTPSNPVMLTDCSIVPPQARIVLLMEYEYMRKKTFISIIILNEFYTI